MGIAASPAPRVPQRLTSALACACVCAGYQSALGCRDCRVPHYYHGEQYLQSRCWCLQVLSHIATNLRDIHAANYVHGDVKPEHILLLRRENRWTVIDHDKAAVSGTLVTLDYTLEYAAPEVVAASYADTTVAMQPSLDSWALGVIAYELLTGDKALDTATDGKESVRTSPLCGPPQCACVGNPMLSDARATLYAAPGAAQRLRKGRCVAGLRRVVPVGMCNENYNKQKPQATLLTELTSMSMEAKDQVLDIVAGILNKDSMQVIAQLRGFQKLPWEDGRITEGTLRQLGVFREPVLGLLRRDSAQRATPQDLCTVCEQVVMSQTTTADV